ncbi:MAG: signal peptidase I [Pseudomonadota bacterium]
MKRGLGRLWSENKGILLFLVLMVVFRSALADWNSVPTGSMKPTIIEGDRILVNKVAYDLRLPFMHTSLLKLADPERGDIIIFDSAVSEQRLVKRVVGVPGDVVEMRNNRLIINGQALQYHALDGNRQFVDLNEDLPGASHAVRILTRGSIRSSFAPLRIPEQYYLALGDNRNNSADSRVIGLVPRNEIIGRTRSVVMSLDYDNYFIPRSERFFKKL